MKKIPLRLRLTLWYLSVFSIALCSFGLSVYLLAKQRLYREMSEQVEAQANNVQRFIQSQRPTITREGLVQELQEEYGVEDAVRWLQIVDGEGTWMYRSEKMHQFFPEQIQPAHVPRKGVVTHFDHDGEHLLVAETVMSFAGRQYVIQTAVPVNGVRHTLSNLRAVFFLLFPAFLMVAAFGSHYVSGHALAPVDDISNLARSINDSNLNRRLPTLRTNDELQRLSDTLNQMLSRIENAFARVRQFTADASHELRTPISLIRTEAELSLRGRTNSEEDYRIALSHIHAESLRTTQLLESLLTLARADSGSGDLTLRPVNVTEFVRGIGSDSETLFELAGLQFEVKVPTGPVMVHADETTLRRLIFILLDNARKYTPSGGRVTLELTIQNKGVIVSVKDTGIGIEPEHLPRIFDRFYRVEKARSRLHGGVGLGLALADWIAKQHDTRISLRSHPGEGSEFSFVLAPTPDELSANED